MNHLCEYKWIINTNVPCMIPGWVKTKLTAIRRIIIVIVVTLQRTEDRWLWIRRNAGLFSEEHTEDGCVWHRGNLSI